MFQWNPLRDIANDKKEIIYQKQNADTYNKLFYVSIIFGFVGLIYLITDLSTGYYNNPYGYLDMTAVLLLLLSSLSLVIVLVNFKDKIISYIQYIASTYFLVISTVMVLFLTVDLLTDKQDFLIVFYNFVLINLIIYYNIVFSLITEAITLIGVLTTVILFTPSSNMVITIEQTSLILTGTIITQHYLRLVKTKSFLNEISLEQMSKEFEESSTVDFLTTLFNRKGLDMFINDDLSKAIASKENISVSMLDIDDFKSYNDYYSHMTGDLCLKKIGMTLNSIATQKFHAFRYGGEEFLIIGLDCTVYELDKINNKILNSVRELNMDRSMAMSVADHITVSIGSAIARLDDIDDFKALLQKADDRLYISKRDGKNRITSTDKETS